MKRLERGVALRLMIVFALVLFASVSASLLRWVAILAAVVMLGSVFVYHQKAYPERLTVTIVEYGPAEGALMIAGTLTNSGALDVYRPELVFSVEDQRGDVASSKSVWPTGQLKRRLASGSSVQFSLSLPAPAEPEHTELTVRSPQYPFDLVMACEQTDSVPHIRPA